MLIGCLGAKLDLRMGTTNGRENREATALVCWNMGGKCCGVRVCCNGD